MTRGAQALTDAAEDSESQAISARLAQLELLLPQNNEELQVCGGCKWVVKDCQ